MFVTIRIWLPETNVWASTGQPVAQADPRSAANQILSRDDVGKRRGFRRAPGGFVTGSQLCAGRRLNGMNSIIKFLPFDAVNLPSSPRVKAQRTKARRHFEVL